MVKYHIGKRGIQRVCRAADGKCPYGAISDHFDSIEDVQKAVDILSQQLADPKNMGIAKTGGTQTIDALTEKQVLILANTRQTLEKIQIARKQMRDIVMTTMDRYEIKKLSDPMVTINKIDATKRQGYDMDALKQLPDYEEKYTKDSVTREHVSFTTLPIDEKSMPHIKMNKDNKLSFEKQSDGSYALSQTGMAYMKQLKDFDEKVKTLEETDKKARTALLDRMKEAGVKSIKVGKVGIDYNAEYTRKILEPKSLTPDMKDTYGKMYDVSPSIRLKFASA